jgi:acetyl-CoA carboxylase beta subunit/acetyl-CoA carboxylase alpha subunit
MRPHRGSSARELIAAVADAGSWQSWDGPVRRRPPDERYAAHLARAAERSGGDESVLTGRATVDGIEVAAVVGDFDFLAGSVGVATAHRIVSATRRATALGLPLLASTASGGTRMQEGTLAFVQMVSIAGALADHKAAGLPYLVYQRHPTTGGVTATWGSLGHLTAAEPDALVGFLGPRVFEAINGAPFPPDVQRSENLRAHGVIDAVIPAAELRGVLARVLNLLGRRSSEPAAPPVPLLTDLQQRTTKVAEAQDRLEPIEGMSPTWSAVTSSRTPDRFGLRELLAGADELVRLSGTGEGERSDALVLALARLRGETCVVVGQDRVAQHAGQLIGPDGLREARRGFALAGELRLPLVTIIDTPGAELSPRAEEGGLAGEIARCLTGLMRLDTPVVSMLLGEGGGGAALALLPADVTVAAVHGWLAPLPPEGASAIIHRTPDRAAELATDQQVDAVSMWRNGIVDVVVGGVEDPTADPTGRDLLDAIGAAVHAADKMSPAERLRRRSDRYQAMGAID